MQVAVNVDGCIRDFIVYEIPSGCERDFPFGCDVQLAVETQGLNNLGNALLEVVVPGFCVPERVVYRETPGYVEINIVVVVINQILLLLWSSFCGFLFPLTFSDDRE